MKTITFIASAILIPLMAFFLIGVFSGQHGCDDGQAARREAEKAILARLKAPATARFSNATGRVSRCEAIINIDVDAQNGFGALIRTPFAVTLKADSEGRQWVVQEVRHRQ